jgi:NAD(P)-dependent dehydrogenase (short-subunit alcohol dehydrogenase family)
VSEDLDQGYGIEGMPVGFADRALADLVGLDGRVAVVVGGSGPNLGQAIVLRLARLGAHVVIVGRNLTIARQTADMCRERGTAEVRLVAGDASDWASIHAAAEQVASDAGRIDVWVNNLGGSRTEGPFATRRQSDVDETVGRNLTSTIYATHAATGVMVGQGAGRIINISADSGKISRPGLGLLCTPTAAVNAFTANVSRELGPAGLTVVAVCPGVMLGPERLALLRDPQADTHGEMRSADYRSNVLKSIGLTSVGRPSTPDEVAAVVAFLASDAASYVHGAAISVAGGTSA